MEDSVKRMVLVILHRFSYQLFVHFRMEEKT